MFQALPGIFPKHLFMRGGALQLPGAWTASVPCSPGWPALLPDLCSLPPSTRAHMVTPENQSSSRKSVVRQTTFHYIDQSLHTCLMCEDPEKNSVTVRGGLPPHLHPCQTVSGRPKVPGTQKMLTNKHPEGSQLQISHLSSALVRNLMLF